MGRLNLMTKTYLVFYNFLQCLGWFAILYHLIEVTFTQGLNGKLLWGKTEVLLKVFQTAAVLEVLHSAMGIVSSKVFVVLPQVFSRLFLLWPIVVAVPKVTIHLSFSLMVAAWSITEVMRYLYYGLNLLSMVPGALQWARYSFFVLLYPIGIAGELLCCYHVLPFYSVSNRYSVLMPNSWNFTFSFYYFIILVMVTYIPGFPKLYNHMFAQRRKVLGPKPDSNKH